MKDSYSTFNANRHALDEVKIGIKAVQNFSTSVEFLDRMLVLGARDDRQLLTAMFTTAVVRYARPFSQKADGKGNRAYSVKQLKKDPGFLSNMHRHLMGIRNTLVAHDDIESIEPRVLTQNMTFALPGQTVYPNFLVPVSIAASNKCLAFPVDDAAVKAMRNHGAACVRAALAKLVADITRLREEALRDPAAADAAARFTGPDEPISSDSVVLSNYSDHPWLTPSNPDFSDVHNGFQYDPVRVVQTFVGLQKIRMPDGSEVQMQIDPSVTSAPKDATAPSKPEA